MMNNYYWVFIFQILIILTWSYKEKKNNYLQLVYHNFKWNGIVNMLINKQLYGKPSGKRTTTLHVINVTNHIVVFYYDSVVN